MVLCLLVGLGWCLVQHVWVARRAFLPVVRLTACGVALGFGTEEEAEVRSEGRKKREARSSRGGNLGGGLCGLWGAEGGVCECTRS